MDVLDQEQADKLTDEEWARAGDRLKRAREFAGLSRWQAAHLASEYKRQMTGSTAPISVDDVAVLEGGSPFELSFALPWLCHVYGIDPLAVFADDPLARVRETEVGRAILAAGGVSDEDKVKLLEFASFLRVKGPAPTTGD